jgi:ribosomal protein S18 acetylase RimI-like enzyme
MTLANMASAWQLKIENKMELKQDIRLDAIVILSHFAQLGDDFIGNLEKSVDSKVYAAKLSSLSQMNAIFINHDLVGLIAYYRSIENSEIFISHVGVIPIWQKKGLASDLVKSVISESSGLTIRLEVIDENLAARRLYESLNFRVSGIVKSKLTMERPS